MMTSRFLENLCSPVYMYVYDFAVCDVVLCVYCTRMWLICSSYELDQNVKLYMAVRGVYASVGIEASKFGIKNLVALFIHLHCLLRYFQIHSVGA